VSDWHSLLMEMAEDDSVKTRDDVIRAPFGYPGSKAAAVDRITPYLPKLRGYCEPFGGTGSVMLARPICPFEIFNDINGGIVSFYRCVRDRQLKDKLVERLEQTIHSREEFIWCRDTWDYDTLDPVETAARWYYMTHYSFGKQGRNFARAKSGKAFFGRALHNNLRLFHPVHNRMYNVQVENLDWRVCLKDFDAHDMVMYLDPPYVDFYENMYVGKMTAADHKAMCDRIFSMQSFVALSGYYDEATRAIYDQYKWDDCITWSQRQRAQGQAFETQSSGYAGREAELHRKVVTEALWIKEVRA
jgi:DNA adenine methylase